MKLLFAASLVILNINCSNAQTKLGLKLTSSHISQRVNYSSDSSDIASGPGAFNLSATFQTEIPFSKYYFFATGVGYTSKRINLKITEPAGKNSVPGKYNIQYVRIPMTMKLYTNEVALDKSLYFQFGPIAEIAVHTKAHDPSLSAVQDFQPLDISLLFATGLQFQLAPNTALQLGLHYTRGLVNIVNEVPAEFNWPVIKNDLVGVDVAVRF